VVLPNPPLPPNMMYNYLPTILSTLFGIF
jgi:hypothetical protein